MADENKTKNPSADPEKIKQLENDLKNAYKDERFDDVRKIAEELKALEPANHLAERLLEKTQKAEADALKKANKDKIDLWEKQIKQAFKVGDLPTVEQLSAEVKKVDPENKVVRKIEEQIEEARAMLSREENKGKIKALEVEIKMLMKAQKWNEVRAKSNELLEIDNSSRVALKAIKKAAKAQPQMASAGEGVVSSAANKPAKEPEKAPEKEIVSTPSVPVASVAETKIEPSKPAPIAEVKPEAPRSEIPVETKPAESAKKEPKTDDTAKPQGSAEGAISQSHPEKDIAIDVSEDLKKETSQKTLETKKEATKKPGFFTRLFSKKEKMPEKTAEVKKEKKPQEKVQKADVKKEPAKPDPKKVKKEKIKALESELKHALKDKQETEVNRLMEEMKALDPKNKTALKVQKKLDKEKADLEASIKKEKVSGLTKEIKEAVKNEDWKKAEDKADELLKEESKNKVALKALKKAKEAQKVPEVKTEKAKKPGFFARLFSKKKAEEKPVDKKAESKASQTQEAVKKEEVKPAPALAEPVKTEAKAERSAPEIKIPEKLVTSAVEQKASAMPAENMQEAKPETKPEPSSSAPKAEQKPDDSTRITPPPKPIIPIVSKPSPAAAPKLKTEAPKLAETTAKGPMPKSAPAPVPLGVAHQSAPEEKKGETAGKKKEAGKGNIFTKLFGEKKTAPDKGGSEKSIIDTIVAKSEEGKKAEQKAKKKPDLYGDQLLHFARVFLEFSVAFILVSAGFFYAQNIDKENRVLSLIGIEENNASRLHAVAQELTDLKKEEKKIDKEIGEYQEGYKDKNKEVIEKIVAGRLDWPDLIQKLNEVTESVYEKNPLSQYVQYNNYAYDVERGELRVSATLSDPLGKNLTKLAELEEAFRYYPKDKNNPNDEREPYFYGLKDFNSFSKNYNKATGRYVSNFSLTLYTKPLEDKKGR